VRSPAKAAARHTSTTRDLGERRGGGRGARGRAHRLDRELRSQRPWQISPNASADGADIVAEGTVTVVYHPVAFLDRLSTTDYSTRSAAASACAATGGRFPSCHDALFRHQPAQGGAGLSGEELVRIGQDVGLNDAAFADRVRGDTYHG
jgi:hypothetical protein